MQKMMPPGLSAASRFIIGEGFLRRVARPGTWREIVGREPSRQLTGRGPSSEDTKEAASKRPSCGLKAYAD